MQHIKLCPCGSEKRYLDCCGPLLLKKAKAETPEALMRSRYSAFVEENWDYLKRTMRPPASLKFNKKHANRNAKQDKPRWVKLEVLNASLDQQNPAIGFVEFKAYYREQNEDRCLHEKSEFHYIEDSWYYVDGM